MQHQALKIADCTSDQDCKTNYPSFPYCDIQGSGHCVSNSNYLIISEGDTFDKNDMCKKYYGDIYVFDVEVNACRVPKCSVEKDYCPKPSKCWRGTVWTIMTSWVEIRQSKINSRSVAGSMGQMNRRPSVWCSKYYFFFMISCRILCKNTFNLFVYFFFKIQK